MKLAAAFLIIPFAMTLSAADATLPELHGIL